MGNPTTGRRTPARIRIWTASVLVFATATLATATVAVADTQRGISDVSLRAAPQARATSDLYFALSDLDAQVARRMLDTGDEDLVGPLLDAELTFNRRLSDVNRDLQQAIAGAGDAVARSAFDGLLDGVSTYHAMASHGLALDESSVETQKGQAAPEALAYYSQATDLMRGREPLFHSRELRRGSAALQLRELDPVPEQGRRVEVIEDEDEHAREQDQELHRDFQERVEEERQAALGQ